MIFAFYTVCVCVCVRQNSFSKALVSLVVFLGIHFVTERPREVTRITKCMFLAYREHGSEGSRHGAIGLGPCLVPSVLADLGNDWSSPE